MKRSAHFLLSTSLFLSALFGLFRLWTPDIAAADSFVPGKATFSARANGEEIAYARNPLFLLPGDVVNFDFDSVGTSCTSGSGFFLSRAEKSCTWKAPSATGSYNIDLDQRGKRISLQAFVMVPFSDLHGDTLNGYRIGSYPVVTEDVSSHPEAYKLPRGFVEVTPENQDVHLSPHFTLGQFVCKQSEGYPKYIVLNDKLLVKLENLLEESNTHGQPADTFFVMSGYRTPYYNQKIENVRLSQHVFGDAADVFLPRDTDQGHRGMGDIKFLSGLVNSLEARPFFRRFIGGMGIYSATANHPPFLHVDVRGWPARW